MLRAGSNLLSSILNQNKLIYSEGISAMCRILWDFNLSISNDDTRGDLLAVNKNDDEKIKKIIKSIFDSYYEKENKIIFDKSSSWTITENIKLLERYVTDKPKIIILNTIKGKGVNYMEDKLEWHYLPMNKELYENAIKQIHSNYI